MTEHEKLKFKYARLLGEYTGHLQALLQWDIPDKLRDRLKEDIKKLKSMPNA